MKKLNDFTIKPGQMLPSNPGKLIESQLNKQTGQMSGVMMFSGDDQTPAAAAVNFDTYFTPMFPVRITNIISAMHYQVAGAGPYVMATHYVEISNSVNNGVLNSYPGTLSTVGVPDNALNASRFFYALNSTGEPFAVDFVLQVGTTYEFKVFSNFRTWGATDWVVTKLSLFWEKA
jgi:hypothetical protein